MKRIYQIGLIVFLLGLIVGCSYIKYLSGGAELSPPPAQLQRFLKAYALVKEYYVKPVSDHELMNNAITGMLEGLDSHSTFLDEKDLERVKQLTSGNYSGIGVEVLPDQGSLKVVSPIDGSPAQKAGILPDDQIIAVDKELIGDLSYRDAIEKIQGPAGTHVKLTLVRPNYNKPIELDVARAELHSEGISSRLLSNGIGYIRISQFQEDTADEVIKTIKALDKQNHAPMKGLILDLRNNPGGLLNISANVADVFLDYRKMGNNHLIVYSKNRDGETQYSAKSDDVDYLQGAPLVILINQGSASGSEIVAGALHDHHRAKLVGMKSFGKGSVQIVLPLDSTSAIKLTTALYYTPNGNLIDHIGITPDVVVEMKPFSKNDLQLKAAEKLFN